MSSTFLTAEDIIEKLNLDPHPEGGYFREIYRSEIQVFPQLDNNELGEKRSAMTSIFFLLKADDFSVWHQVKSDEVWNLFMGGPLELHQIKPSGYNKTILANDFGGGFVPQETIRGGTLQAARPAPGSEFALCSCIVAPGFDFSDFSIPSRRDLLSRYPEYESMIIKLTRD